MNEDEVSLTDLERVHSALSDEQRQGLLEELLVACSCVFH